MTTYILEYDDVAMQADANAFSNRQFTHKRGFASMHELSEAISKLPDGTKGRYDDGADWYYFTAGQSGRLKTVRGEPGELKKWGY